MLVFFFCSAGFISLVSFFLLRDRSGSVPALLAKISCSFFFLATAFAAALSSFSIDLPNLSVYALFIVMGLSCGMIGDIVLDLKIMHTEHSSLYQHAGMLAFFVGHVFYILLLFQQSGFSLFALLSAILITMLILLVSYSILKFRFKEHTVDTVLYSFILCWFMTQSVYAYLNNGTTMAFMLAVGAVLFLLSDLVLVMTYYNGKDSKPYIIVNHSLYYAAQYCIALSLLFLSTNSRSL